MDARADEIEEQHGSTRGYVRALWVAVFGDESALPGSTKTAIQQTAGEVSEKARELQGVTEQQAKQLSLLHEHLSRMENRVTILERENDQLKTERKTISRIAQAIKYWGVPGAIAAMAAALYKLIIAP